MRKIHPKVEEAVDTLDLNPVTRRRLLAGTGLASASLAADALLTACRDDRDAGRRARGNFPATPKWKFVFVCHVTDATRSSHPPSTAPRTPARCSAASTSGPARRTRSSAEMVNATNTAVSAKADGIALAVVDKARVHRARSTKALDAGIPVVSLQRRRRPGQPRHQPAGLHRAGPVRLGVRARPAGAGRRFDSGDVVGFIATPGPAQHPAAHRRRPAGVQGVRQAGHTFTPIATERRPHPRVCPSSTRTCRATRTSPGLLAVDAGSTQSVGQVGRRSTSCEDKGLKVAGGFDLHARRRWTASRAATSTTPSTSSRTCRASCRCIALYLYKLSGGLVSPPRDQHRRCSFVTKDNVDPYQRRQDAVRGLGHRAEARRALRARSPHHERPGAAVDATAPTTPLGDGRAGRGAAGAPAAVPRRVGDAFLRRREASVLLVAIGLAVYFQTAIAGVPRPRATCVNDRAGDARRSRSSPPGIVLLLVSGEIDLSVGMVYALAPFLMHYAIDFYGVPVIPAILLALADRGAVIGLVNGLITIACCRCRRSSPRWACSSCSTASLLTTSHAYPVPIPEAATGRSADVARRRRLGLDDLVPGHRGASSTWCSPAPAGACTPSRSAATCSAPARPASGSTGSRSATS